MGAPLNLATTYTEVDPAADITLTTVTCAASTMAANISAYVYKDWTAGYFGDFVHDFEHTSATLSAAGARACLWGVTNSIGSQDAWAAGLYVIAVSSGTTLWAYTLGEVGGSTSVGATHSRSAQYCRVERNGTTLTFRRASSAANRAAGVWAETLTVTVATTTYQYQYAISSINAASTSLITISTANVKGTLMTSASTPFDSAYMTGGATGNWNAGTTWGNAGSVKGTDYPGTIGDVVNIDVGDTITYNVSETNALGVVGIYGKLSFSNSMNTKLTVGTSTMTIASGGELEVGTVLNPIGAAYLAELYFNATSESANGIVVNTGGQITINGSDFIKGVLYTRLISDWSAGQTFTVSGDLTAKWASGQNIIVNRYSANGAAASELYEYTIASLAANAGNTDITINEAAPGITFREGGLVANMYRNVVLAKEGYVKTNNNYNTLKPSFMMQGTTMVATINHAIFAGWYQNPIYDVNDSDGIVFRNQAQSFGHVNGEGNRVHTRCTHLYCSSSVAKTNTTFNELVSLGGGNSHTNQAQNCLYSNSVFICQGLYLDLNMYAGNTFNKCSFIGHNGGQSLGYAASFTKLYNCRFGGLIGATNNSTSVKDMAFNNNVSQWLYNCKFVTDDPVFNIQNGGVYRPAAYIASENHNGVFGDNRFYYYHANMKRNTTTVRVGGATSSMQVTALSNLSHSFPFKVLEWVEQDVPASSTTRSVYILGTGWTVWPTASELYFEVEYLKNAGDSEYAALIASTAVLTDNVTWVRFPVTFTPGRVGIARYRLWYKKYEAGADIFVDAQLNS